METNKIKASLYNNQIISQTTNCPSFVSYIDEEIRKLSNAGRNGTAQNYKAAMNSFTNGCGCDTIQIDCKAHNCTYNEHCKCTAASINVSGDNAIAVVIDTINNKMHKHPSTTK